MRFFAEKTAKYRCFLHRNILFPQCNHLNTLALKVHNLKFAIVSALTDVKQMFSSSEMSKECCNENWLH